MFCITQRERRMEAHKLVAEDKQGGDPELTRATPNEEGTTDNRTRRRSQ